MFAGITWGQFALYVGLAVVIYYLAVILVYYRRELSEKISNSTKNTSREPRLPAAPEPVSPIGASTDYGQAAGQPIASPEENHSPPTAKQVLPRAIINPYLDHPPAKPGNTPGQEPPVFLGDPIQEALEKDDLAGQQDDSAGEEAFEEAPEPEENEAYITGEVNVDTELIGFGAGETEEVNEGGTSLETLENTVELLTRKEISPAEEKELSRRVGLLEGTQLMNNILDKYEGASTKIDRFTKEAWAGRGGEGPGLPRPAAKEAFAEVDIKLLIKDQG